MSGRSRGRLTISLDTEIAWGRIAADDLLDFREQFARTREVVDRLLDLFDAYETPVTWALVGRLIEPDELRTSSGRPRLADYFDGKVDESCYEDPSLTADGESFLRFPELVETIRRRTVRHELGSHSYNHCFFEEIDDAELVRRDFEAMEAVASAQGFAARSFVFPKNQVAHLDELTAQGIRVYRGPDEHWYSAAPRIVQKLVRQLDNVLPNASSTVRPRVRSDGLVNVPGSMVFRREHRGVRRHLPVSLLAMKAARGLRRAARKGEVLHLWFHPFNFGYRTDEHFSALERVLAEANELRSRQLLEVLTMGDYAADRDLLGAERAARSASDGRLVHAGRERLPAAESATGQGRSSHHRNEATG